MAGAPLRTAIVTGLHLPLGRVPSVTEVTLLGVSELYNVVIRSDRRVWFEASRARESEAYDGRLRSCREAAVSPHRPDYPPKTPPPPKRPIEPPRPEQQDAPLPAPVTIRGRSVRNWALTPSPAAAARVGREVADVLHRWGYRPKDDRPRQAVELLVRSAAEDGGRRISLHLADDEQRNQVMVLALSHRQDMPPGDDDQVLRDTQYMRALSALGPRDVGVETTPDGRRWWAGLDLPRPSKVPELEDRGTRAALRAPSKMERPPATA